MNTQAKNIRRSITIIIIALVLIIGGFIIYSAINSFTRRGKSSVIIYTVPTDTIISVNGVQEKKSTLYLQPGKYEITAKSDGFYEQKLNITVADEDINLPIILEPRSSEAKDWMENNEEKYREAERIAGENLVQRGEEIRNKHPIIDKLPYRRSLFRIDYYIEESGDNFKIQITSSSALGRQTAIELIRNWGFEPTDYVFEFREFTNPFTTKEGR